MKHKFKQLAAVLQRLILTRFILGGFFIGCFKLNLTPSTTGGDKKAC